MTSWLSRLMWRVMLLTVLATAVYWGWIYASPWVNQPIRQVMLQGDIPRIEQQRIMMQLQSQALGEFFNVDLHQVKDQVEDNPWIDSAVVSRVWPDRLMVEVSPQIIVARWGENQVLNHHWQVMDVDLDLVPDLESLPLLQGPPEQTDNIAQHYRAMNAILAREELAIDSLHMAKRGAVDLALNNRIQVRLGRDEGMQRLQRVVQIYTTDLASVEAPIVSIDGRYPHGVAVSFAASNSSTQ